VRVRGFCGLGVGANCLADPSKERQGKTRKEKKK